MKTLKTLVALLCLVFIETQANAVTNKKQAHTKLDIPYYLTSEELRNKEKHVIAIKPQKAPVKVKTKTTTDPVTFVPLYVEDQNATTSEDGPYGWDVQLNGTNNYYHFDSFDNADTYIGQEWHLPNINIDTYTITVAPYWAAEYGDGYFDIGLGYNDGTNTGQNPEQTGLNWYYGNDDAVFTGITIGAYYGNSLVIFVNEE